MNKLPELYEGDWKNMHMVIRAIVYAKSEEEAMEKAEEVFERHSGEGRPFDYYTMFRDEDTSPVSGRSRWGDIPAVELVQCAKFGTEECDKCADRFKCFTRKTRELIDEGMQATRSEFQRNLDEVRKYLASGKTDDELFEDSMFGYYAHCLYRSNPGPDCWLYDQDGEPIENNSHLRGVLSKWEENYKGRPEENPYKDMSIFVIPADVHY